MFKFDYLLQGPVSAELHLLLAKYHFFVNDYTQSIQSVDKSQVTRDNVEELSKRACILASEAFSFKGDQYNAIFCILSYFASD